jgi:cytochrome c biogenesis protein
MSNESTNGSTHEAKRMQRPVASDPGPGRDPQPPRARELWKALYDLLSNPGFAIVILIVLAVASILGIIILDQLPVRGEMARVMYADRQNDPLIWLLIHVVPDKPFRSPVYETLLALLSLSLLACTIKRWRQSWRLALTLPSAPPGAFEGGDALRWRTAAADAPQHALRFLREHAFRVASSSNAAHANGETLITASRLGIARLGPVFTHLGFLLLVVGAIVIGVSGSAQMLWLQPGERAELPRAGLDLRLDDFRIEMTPGGRIVDYISEVTLRENGADVRSTKIEVNKPLRYRGYSIYQNSYRENPTRTRSIHLVCDAGAAAPSDPTPAHDRMGPHARSAAQFANPITLAIPWDKRVALPGQRYAVEIDTFLIDFVVGADGPELASTEPRNPAVQLSFFAADTLAGSSWYFLNHPGMAVGSGPDLPLLFADFSPEYVSGLEIATHPGAAWVWAGFVVMGLGTILAFLLRHERVWVRLRRAGEAWEIALIHHGVPRQSPEFARAAWETQATPLAIRLVHTLEPEGAAPVRGPEGRSA